MNARTREIGVHAVETDGSHDLRKRRFSVAVDMHHRPPLAVQSGPSTASDLHTSRPDMTCNTQVPGGSWDCQPVVVTSS